MSVSESRPGEAVASPGDECLFGFVSRDARGVLSLGWVEHVIQVLILLSLVAFALETLPGLSASELALLQGFEMFSVAVFTIEYLTRLALTRPRRRYVLSFFGLIDIISIVPFYLSLGVGTESMRALRLLRLFRMFKLVRYNSAMLRFYRALVIAREELILFGTTALLLLYLAGVGVYQFERVAQPDVFRSVFDGLWWALCTLTTVGYGDVFPVTVGGRLFTFLILVVGLGVIAVPTGLVASALSQARAELESGSSA